MTRHYLDLGNYSDWLKQIPYAVRPTRSATHISVVTRHQYGISALVSSFRRHFVGKQVVQSRNVGCFLQYTCPVLNLLFHWSPLICTSIVLRDRGIVM